MNTETVIPGAGPIPLPAPSWVFDALLIVTFTLHLFAMNAALGGAVIAAASRIRGRGREDLAVIAKSVAKLIPSLMAATITLGVGALLFAQVLYGQALYTSSIIMAWPWFLVLVLIVVGYYGFYGVAFRADRSPAFPVGVLVASILLFALVAFVFTNNLTLASTPDKWAALYYADPSGWTLNWDEATLLPRFAHFATASIAVGGILVIVMGLFRWKHDAAVARRLISHGGGWFNAATMVQFGIGIWFLLALRPDQLGLFLGDDLTATIALPLGVVLVIGAIFAAARARRAADPRRPAWSAVTHAAFAIAAMVVARATLRKADLSPWIKPAEFSVDTQWGPMVIFLGLFVLGIVVWIWMLRRFFPSIRSPS